MDTGRKADIVLHLDLDMGAFLQKQKRVAIRNSPMGKVEAKGNIKFDAEEGRANVVKEVKFRPRWFGVERVDEPTAEFAEKSHAKAVAADIAAIYQVKPRNVQIVRLRRAVPPGAYSADREAWLQLLALNQGERIRQLVVEAGVPADSVSVSVQFAMPGAPASLLFADFAAHSPLEEAFVVEGSEDKRVETITRNGLVVFHSDLGRVDIRSVQWKPRLYTGPDTIEEPFAEPADNEAFANVMDDLFKVWQIFQVPAVMFGDVPRIADSEEEHWFQAVGYNRAVYCKQALVDRGLPEALIYAGATGHQPDSFPPSPRRNAMNVNGSTGEQPGVSNGCASPLASPRSGASSMAATRIRIRAELQKAAVMHTVDAIPVLEAILNEAKSLGLQGQWTRVDPLITDAEQQLKTLLQRKRRQEAWGLHKDRNTALAHVKLGYVQRSPPMKAH